MCRQLEEAAAGLLAQRERRMVRARQYVPELLPEAGETAARAQEIAAAVVEKKGGRPPAAGKRGRAGGRASTGC